MTVNRLSGLMCLHLTNGWCKHQRTVRSFVFERDDSRRRYSDGTIRQANLNRNSYNIHGVVAHLQASAANVPTRTSKHTRNRRYRDGIHPLGNFRVDEAWQAKARFILGPFNNRSLLARDWHPGLGAGESLAFSSHRKPYWNIKDFRRAVLYCRDTHCTKKRKGRSHDLDFFHKFAQSEHPAFLLHWRRGQGKRIRCAQWQQRSALSAVLKAQLILMTTTWAKPGWRLLAHWLNSFLGLLKLIVWGKRFPLALT